MTSTPTISVVMSVYNAGPYLRPAVESVLAQTFTDNEYIFIDDGSTDDSPNVLREYAARDKRIRLTVRPNKGLTVTLNEGLHQARGEFVARMDCDDVSLPDRFEKQLAWFRAHPDLVCIGGHFALVDEKGRLLTVLRPPSDDESIQKLLLAGHTAITHPSAMMRRDAALRVGGYDPFFKTTQDLDLWLRLGEIGKLGNVPQLVLKFRQHGGSISENKREEQRRFGREACERAWKRRGLAGMTYEAAEPWRPGRDRHSRHAFALRYGWWGFNSAARGTALAYGWKAVRIAPWKIEGWKLLAAAVMKSMPAAPEGPSSLSPVLRGEGGGEGPALKSAMSDPAPGIPKEPLTPTLSPEYRGEGEMAADAREVRP